MRVTIHVDAVAHALPGGIGAYVRRLVEELLRDPEEAQLRLLASRSAALPDDWPSEAVDHTPLPMRLQYLAWNALRLGGVRGADIVHATALVTPPAERLVATVHDDVVDRFPHLVPSFWRRLYRRGLRIVVREARVVCANSEATKRRIVERYGLDPGRVVTTPLAPLVSPGHPQDPSVLDRFALTGPFVLNVATLEPRKNQAALVRAFAQADLPSHRLVLAGAEGWGRAEVLRAVEDSAAKDRIVVTGRLGDAEVAALYARADAFAFPSLHEGFGLPLLEALAHGVPSVASTDEALIELGGDAAVSVDATDEPALAAALRRVCTDDDLRVRLRRSGPARAEQYTWRRCAEATIGAWRRAMRVER